MKADKFEADAEAAIKANRPKTGASLKKKAVSSRKTAHLQYCKAAEKYLKAQSYLKEEEFRSFVKKLIKSAEDACDETS